MQHLLGRRSSPELEAEVPDGIPQFFRPLLVPRDRTVEGSPDTGRMLGTHKAVPSRSGFEDGGGVQGVVLNVGGHSDHSPRPQHPLEQR